MDLESLLTSRDGFGLESATFLQRAKCRIIDGAPLDDLLAAGSPFERRCLEAATGCSPSELPVGAPPIEVEDFGPVRTGKSLGLAALSTCRSQTIDPSIIKAGEEPPRISILATSTDNANAVRGHLNVIHERPMLRSLLVGETADSVTLRHPSGLPVEIRVIAAHRGGYSLASRWSGTTVFDEAPGWYSTDRIVSLEESREQALGRLLPGAQAIYAGSKWQPSGFCFESWRNHFGKPTAEMVVISPTTVDAVTPATQLNPLYWTPERVDRVRRTSPRTFTMHVLNQWGAAGNSAFTTDEVEACTQAELPHHLAGAWFCAIDASALRHDSFAAVLGYYGHPSPHRVVKLRHTPDGLPYRPVDPQWPDDFEPTIKAPVLRIAEVVSMAPPDTVSTLDVVRVIAAKCRQRGISVIFGDQFEAGSLAGLFSQHGIGLRTWHWSQQSKDEAIAGALRRMFREQRISLVPHDRLRRELLSIREIPTPGGGWRYPTGGLDCAAALITLAHALNDPEIVGARTNHRTRIDGNPGAAFSGGRYVVSR